MMRVTILMVLVSAACPQTKALGLGWRANDATDSCVYSYDGVCDEPAWCTAGTDCTDCGTCSLCTDLTFRDGSVWHDGLGDSCATTCAFNRCGPYGLHGEPPADKGCCCCGGGGGGPTAAPTPASSSGNFAVVSAKIASARPFPVPFTCQNFPYFSHIFHNKAPVTQNEKQAMWDKARATKLSICDYTSSSGARTDTDSCMFEAAGFCDEPPYCPAGTDCTCCIFHEDGELFYYEEDACRTGHDERDGETSKTRCEAMSGCVYTETTDDCAAAADSTEGALFANALRAAAAAMGDKKYIYGCKEATKCLADVQKRLDGIVSITPPASAAGLYSGVAVLVAVVASTLF